MHFLLSIRFTFIWPFCFLCKSTNTSWAERVSRVWWPNQLFEIFSSTHVNPCRFFAAEGWNHQSGKEPTHRCPRLAGNGTKRLRQIFFLSSLTPSWRASHIQVRLRIRGRQRKWRKSSMAALFMRDEHTQGDLWEDGYGTAVIPCRHTRRSRKQQRPDRSKRAREGRSDKTPHAQASNTPSCQL